MLPPVLELYALWHPRDDRQARPLAEALVDHYHGDLFSGLIGGAIEVCFRSEGWGNEADSAPRPLVLPGDAGPLPPAAYGAVLCFLGPGLARAVAQPGPWRDVLQALITRAHHDPNRVILRAVALEGDPLAREPLRGWFGATQLLASPDPLAPKEDRADTLCRDLSQSLAQALTWNAQAPGRIQIFLSHTKHAAPGERESLAAFVAGVRRIIGNTRLGLFFDANVLQPGDDWAQVLERHAATSALLVLRTDHYAERLWCQQEVATAKTLGMPVVVLDALERSESRGSFLLDHAPRLRATKTGPRWDEAPVRRALGVLVDECLKRALWHHQAALAGPEAGVDWWAPHAPEPLTLTHWLNKHPSSRGQRVILHPDPPLTQRETEALEAVAGLAKPPLTLTILTPRTLAARPSSLDRLPLEGKRLGLSASDQVPDLGRRGLDRRHLRLALAEMARLVLLDGGTLAWGGHLEPEGLTPLLLEEVRRYGHSGSGQNTPASDLPLLVVLAWSVHRATPLSVLEATDAQLGSFGRLICLNRTGEEIPFWSERDEAPQPVSDPQSIAESLSALRTTLTTLTCARLMIGGRCQGFTGRAPGLVEEAILSLKAGQPLYLAAGFGGATAEIARTLGLPVDALPQTAPRNPRLDASLAALADQARLTPPRPQRPVPRRSSPPGPHPRPSHLATLVSQGLGRWASSLKTR
ncbi:hypothetical protein [Pararhodospirillum photometricum]|nr:hypothetical protein [Pararhodospirillum photometricum]